MARWWRLAACAASGAVAWAPRAAPRRGGADGPRPRAGSSTRRGFGWSPVEAMELGQGLEAIFGLVLQSAAPGDDFQDFEAISLAEVSASVGAPRLVRFMALATAAARGVVRAALTSTDEERERDRGRRRGPLGARALLRLATEPKVLSRFVQRRRKTFALDAGGELVLWVTYGALTHKFDLDSTTAAQAVAYGAFSGVVARGAKRAAEAALADDAVLADAATPPAADGGALRLYARDGLSGGVMFSLYDEVFYDLLR
ncbi:hypothetical protein M885DRAFT_528340 [Pelagophyceae sp. CCMP2097]|nr:hypothetical protein M885DRAFT_528340 [Pelagophyceae sp. CCMP2097]